MDAIPVVIPGRTGEEDESDILGSKDNGVVRCPSALCCGVVMVTLLDEGAKASWGMDVVAAGIGVDCGSEVSIGNVEDLSAVTCGATKAKWSGGTGLGGDIRAVRLEGMIGARCPSNGTSGGCRVAPREWDASKEEGVMLARSGSRCGT